MEGWEIQLGGWSKPNKSWMGAAKGIPKGKVVEDPRKGKPEEKLNPRTSDEGKHKSDMAVIGQIVCR